MTKEVIDIGNAVVCDDCNGDYTESEEYGGLLFGGGAYCPACAQRMKETIAKCGEAHLIEGECPDGVSFADWVRSIRTTNTITIETLD